MGKIQKASPEDSSGKYPEGLLPGTRRIRLWPRIVYAVTPCTTEGKSDGEIEQEVYAMIRQGFATRTAKTQISPMNCRLKT